MWSLINGSLLQVRTGCKCRWAQVHIAMPFLSQKLKKHLSIHAFSRWFYPKRPALFPGNPVHGFVIAIEQERKPQTNKPSASHWWRLRGLAGRHIFPVTLSESKRSALWVSWLRSMAAYLFCASCETADCGTWEGKKGERAGTSRTWLLLLFSVLLLFGEEGLRDRRPEKSLPANRDSSR